MEVWFKIAEEPAEDSGDELFQAVPERYNRKIQWGHLGIRFPTPFETRFGLWLNIFQETVVVGGFASIPSMIGAKI